MHCFKLATFITLFLLTHLLGLCIGYSTIETKEAARIGYNGSLFSHEYSGEGRGAEHQGRHLSTDILITAYSSVVTVAEWLDGSFESQNRL